MAEISDRGQLAPGHARPAWLDDPSISALLHVIGIQPIERAIGEQVAPAWAGLRWLQGPLDRPPNPPLGGARIYMVVDHYASVPVDLWPLPPSESGAPFDPCGHPMLPVGVDCLILPWRAPASYATFTSPFAWGQLYTWLVLRACGTVQTNPQTSPGPLCFLCSRRPLGRHTR